MDVDVYRAHGPILPLLRRFETAAERSAAREAKRERADRYSRTAWGAWGYGWWSLALVGGVVALGGPFGLSTRADEIRRAVRIGPSAVLPMALVALALWWGLLYWKWKAERRKLDPRRLDAVVRLLRFLRADTRKDEPVRLLVDFRDCATGGRLRGARADPVRGSLKIVTSTRLVHTWLELRGSLADRSRYFLSATDRVRRRERGKPGSRTPARIVDRVAGELILRLRIHPRSGLDPGAVRKILEDLPVPARLASRGIRVRGRWLHVRLATRGWAYRAGVRSTISATGVRVQEVRHTDRMIGAQELLAALLWTYDAMARAQRSPREQSLA